MTSVLAKQVLQTLPFFSELEEAERSILLDVVSIKDYPRRTPLFLQGDKSWKFFVILKGWIKLYNLTENGEEIIVGMLKGGDVIGDVAAFDGSAHAFSATVVEDARLAEIPAEVMRERVMENPVLAAKMMAVVTSNLLRLRIENGHLTVMNASQRLSCLLLRLSSYMTGNGGTFSLPYDKSIMAAQLGLEPATLSRVFVKLEEHGVKNKGSEVHIDDFSVLSACCCSRCPVPEGECAGRRTSRKEVIKCKKAA